LKVRARRFEITKGRQSPQQGEGTTDAPSASKRRTEKKSRGVKPVRRAEMA